MIEFSDGEYDSMLADAIDAIDQSKAAHGIGLRALNEGMSSLSPKQLAVFNMHIQPLLRSSAVQRERELNRDRMERDD